MESRYKIGKDSLCYGCQHFKAVEGLDYKPDPEDIQCGGYCDCPTICFAGNQNKYKEN